MISQTTASTTYLVSLDQLKDHLAITDDTNEDTRLTLMLGSSRDLIERETNYCFTSQVWTQTHADFPSDWLDLDKLPITNLVVKYYDADNVLTTLNSSNYYLVQNDQYASIKPVDDWPTVYDRPEAVQLTLTCGVASVQPAIQHACLMLCAAWSENREAEIIGTITNEIKLGYDRLIRSFRRGLVC